MRKLWLIFFLSLYCHVLWAQNPVVNFTATPVRGCAPLVVNFTDQSTGNPTNWDWDLGNGQLSTTRNPIVVYNVPGVYTVRLVVRNASGIAQTIKTDFIVVNPTPNANFTSNTTTACAPGAVNFTDQSTSNNSNITGWVWDFGDGTSSTAQNPSHSYQTPGFYNVSLRVTNADGCSGATSRERYIRIVPGVVADFSQPTSNTCTAPFNLSFGNQSSGPGNLTYQWDLGNGNTSTAQNPGTSYTTAGSYNVRLITSSDYGCADTATKPVVFTENVTRFSVADTVCLNVPANFVNTSSPAPSSSSWDFGNGATAESISPSYTYDSAGIYTVKLINNYGNCIDSVTKQITIGPKPQVDFTSNITASCSAPFTVDFKDLTANSSSWAWDFGDGTTSTVQNPRKTYTQLGSYDITLSAVFGGGCENSITKVVFIKVEEPVVSISNAPTGGCIPYTFVPTHNVIAVDGIASWFWDFGDGTTSNLENPTHVYPNVGNYDIRLRVVTNSGCTKEIVYPRGVRTGTPVTPDFVADKFSVCASDPVQFTNLTVGADQYRWEFGDGTNDTARNAVHRFADTGYVNIRLIAFNNRCPSTITKNAYIRVLPPIARFNYSVDCGNKLRVNFRDSSIIDPTLGNLTYTWTFGNSLGTATGRTPSFMFPGYGRYPVTLTVTNGSTCVHSHTGSVLLIDERASFTASKTEICKDEQFLLTASTAVPQNIRFYQWQIGNAAPILDTVPTLRYRIADAGFYNVRLIIIDTNYCRDTVTLNNYLQVIGPDVDFVPDLRGTCLNTSVSFTDRTVSPIPLTKWFFEFGDGTTAEFPRGPFTHRYQRTGVFSVKLTVTDNRGCSSSKTIRDTLIITSPKAGFRADTIYCPGVDLRMIDTSSGRNLTYNWSFGDGTGSTLRNPLKNYPPGDRNYSIALKVTDDFGCSDSVSKAEYVKVRSPKAAFTAADTTGICPPLEARFFLEAKDYQSFYWDFGDGGYPSYAPNPRHFYNTFNVFTAKLVAIGYGGCRDSATHRVTLSNPRSTIFNYDPLEACNAVTVNFHLKVPPYTRYSLLYGDGEVRHTQDTAFSHFYRGPAFFNPSVFLTDSLGCTAYLSQYPAIRVIGAKPLFGSSRKQFCDTGTVTFANFTIYNDSISSYNWSFGDGTVSNEYSPTHHYSFPGNNVVKLLVRTERGCVDSLLDTINVYRTPVASIVIADTICINRPAQFTGRLAVADTNTVRWTWNFGNGQVSDLQNPRINFAAVGDYTVTLRTETPSQCAHDTTKRIYVPPAPTIDLPERIDIISGAGITLPAVYTGNIIDYKWTPNFRLDCADCPNPYANPIKTQKYNIVVTDRYTCVARDEVTVFVLCGDKNLFLPNTFSPNNDGTNDRFYPRGTGLFQIKSLRIFNRWGEMVYEQRNFNANNAPLGWDGNHKGQRAPQDTYVYSIEVVCENSEVSTFKGNVTLVR